MLAARPTARVCATGLRPLPPVARGKSPGRPWRTPTLLIVRARAMGRDCSRGPASPRTVDRPAGWRPSRPAPTIPAMPTEGHGTLEAWVEVAEAIRGTRARLKKNAALTAYLRILDDTDLAIAARFFAGNVFAR